MAAPSRVTVLGDRDAPAAVPESPDEPKAAELPAKKYTATASLSLEPRVPHLPPQAAQIDEFAIFRVTQMRLDRVAVRDYGRLGQSQGQGTAELPT